jgi:hypothetical protein
MYIRQLMAGEQGYAYLFLHFEPEGDVKVVGSGRINISDLPVKVKRN